jgi:glucokinase
MTAIVADIGGTNSRFALTEGDGGLVGVRKYVNREFASLDEVVAAYIDDCGVRPRHAVIAVAGPVKQQEVTLTNLGWHFSANSLQQQHRIAVVELMNDFAALAWATLMLQPADLMPVNAGEAIDDAPRAVIGPGTGLGVGGVVSARGGWTVVSGEGGHVTLAAMTERERQLIDAAHAEFGHCSAERLLSGSGLLYIYRWLGGTAADAAAVTAGAQSGDSLALDAYALFFDLLATVSADLALTLGARGGVYLAGGILPQVSELLLASGFADRFRTKGRLSDYLTAIPVHLVVADEPALMGLSGYLRDAK